MSSSDQAPIVLPPIAVDPWYVELMGRALMALDQLPRLKKFGVVSGSRRMLGDRTPRPALDLKLVENPK